MFVVTFDFVVLVTYGLVFWCLESVVCEFCLFDCDVVTFGLLIVIVLCTFLGLYVFGLDLLVVCFGCFVLFVLCVDLVWFVCC